MVEMWLKPGYLSPRQGSRLWVPGSLLTVAETSRVCELSEKNAFCMFYLAPTRGATTFRARAPSRSVVAPVVGARIIHRRWSDNVQVFPDLSHCSRLVRRLASLLRHRYISKEERDI